MRPMPCESELTIAIAPSSWSGPSAAIVAAWIALADELDVARHGPRQPVVEHGHRDVLGGRVDAERQRRRGRRAQDRRLAHEADEVGHVAAAGALDVVGVDGPAGDRGDRVLELGGLVQPVGVERDVRSRAST